MSEAEAARLPLLERAADDCFARTMSVVRTPKEHEAAIGAWNELLDDAADNARRVMRQYTDQRSYALAVVARDMAMYLTAMRATKDAPFRPTPPQSPVAHQGRAAHERDQHPGP